MTDITPEQKAELERLDAMSMEKLYLHMNNLDRMSSSYNLASLAYSKRCEEKIQQTNRKQLRIAWLAVAAAWGSAIAAFIQLLK
jgi:hypothetical protein